MKKILFLLLIPVFLHAQTGYYQRIFTSSDTIASLTSSDSVEIQLADASGPWKLLTSSVNDTALITGDDKVAENLVIFSLANETWWTRVSRFRVRIYSTSTDTITSNWLNIPNTDGSFSLFVQPDTNGTNTYYNKSWVEGK